jgi:hypothetical protein
MTRAELAMGSMTFIAAIVAGSLSVHLVDRHFANKKSAPNNSAPVSSTSSACVAADGSWKNWVWANVPMLSPKCAVDR